MDIKKIEKLMELMKTHQLTEIEVDEKGDRVRISMASAAQPVSISAPMAVPVVAAAHKTELAAPIGSENRKVMRSPFVGTFYAAPAPDAAPFVKPGQSVRKGQTLCIIEAMKLMNEIEAEADMTIAEVLVQNGQAIEFDQPLFALR